jgi:hypothetical protein
MPPLSLRCAEAVTYRILKGDNGGSSCENNKIGNKSFPESRNVTMSHRICLLPVTGNYISELIILIILKSSMWQRCGYTTIYLHVRKSSMYFLTLAKDQGE